MAAAVAFSNVPTNIPLSSVPGIVDYLWKKLADQIIQGNTNEIRIPLTVKPVIGQQGVDVIKTRFQYVKAF